MKSVSSTTREYPFPVTKVPLNGPVWHGYWLLPYNNSLSTHPIFRIAQRSEYIESIIGELDDLLGTADTNECILIDPMFPAPLPYVEGMRRKLFLQHYFYF